VSVEIEQVGPSTGQATARTHTVFVDRPTDKGGHDRGPLGGEYLLVSLGQHAARRRSTREADVRMRVRLERCGV
jgi:hypothetical protein